MPAIKVYKCEIAFHESVLGFTVRTQIRFLLPSYFVCCCLAFCWRGLVFYPRLSHRSRSRCRCRQRFLNSLIQISFRRPHTNALFGHVTCITNLLPKSVFDLVNSLHFFQASLGPILLKKFFFALRKLFFDLRTESILKMFIISPYLSIYLLWE